MRIPKTVSFTNPQLFQGIESYAKHRSIDFSQAVSELSEAGLSLYKKSGSLNIENVKTINDLKRDVDYLKGDVKKLWLLQSDFFRKHGRSPKRMDLKKGVVE
jgi:hypothetical protein